MRKVSPRYEDFKAELLADPEIRREYEALGPEFELRRSIISLRKLLDISQKELAELVGTKQAAISRFETGRVNVSIGFLHRLAEALNADLCISFEPRQQERMPSQALERNRSNRTPAKVTV